MINDHSLEFIEECNISHYSPEGRYVNVIEIYAWLKNQIGPYGINWKSSHYVSRHTFKFKSKDDLLLFTLRWR